MKKFHLTDTYAIVNFDKVRCSSEVDIIDSPAFKKVLDQFIKYLQDTNHLILNELPKLKTATILNIYKNLVVYTVEQVQAIFDDLLLVKYRKQLYDFTQLFYDFWRKKERFGLSQLFSLSYQQTKKLELIAKTDLISDKIISLYRIVSQKLLGEDYSVFRQLPAGINANLLYYKSSFSKNSDYANLQKIGFITGLVLKPPFIINSKSNRRQGFFKEIYENPLPNIKISKHHYLAFPLKVGTLLAFVYIHRDLLHHGIALANLFEFSEIKEFRNRKPDLVYVYGIKENEYDCTFYHDEKEDIYLGFVSRDDKNDYFGYLKKMILTLHNVHMIDKGNLPVHGAMASITLNNNQKKNIVIIGDSGTGKSETLEALKNLGKDFIKEMDIIFDDMGTFIFNEQNIIAHGTETGAFVRIDDLGLSFIFDEMDRAIFMNPERKNARLVVPISMYEDIIGDHSIDIVLYANNYSEHFEGIKLFNNVDEALEIFKKGTRVAKGTTTEVGLVNTFFANPFGPVQRESQTNVLLEKYFNFMYDNNIIVGEIFTKLASPGQATKGPTEAAKLLLEFLYNNNN